MIRRIIGVLGVASMSLFAPQGKALDTADIISATFDIDTLKSCQDYCFVDVCVFWKCTLLGGCGFTFYPRIDHYNPDLVVSVYNLDAGGNSLNPWDWARGIDNSVGKPVGGSVVSLLTGNLGIAGPGPGFASNGEQGGHRQVVSREADVVGHPLASMPALMAGNALGDLPDLASGIPDAQGMIDGISDMAGDLGASAATSGDASNPASVPVPAAGDQSGQLAKNSLTGLKNASTPINKYGPLAGIVAPQVAGMINGIAAAASVVNTVADTLAEVQKVNDKIQKIMDLKDDLIGGGDTFAIGVPGFSLAIDYLLCPSETTSFFPYYLSQLDAVGWRFAVPEMFYPQALVPGLDEIGNFPWYTWGSLYPRAGSLSTKNIDQAGAVFAQRAANIATKSGQPHVYVHAAGPVADSFGAQLNGGTKWQMLSPRKETTCAVFGTTPDYPAGYDNVLANTLTKVTQVATGLGNLGSGGVSGLDENTQGNFSWALWRHYNCCSGSGKHYAGNLSDGIDVIPGLGSLVALVAEPICLKKIL